MVAVMPLGDSVTRGNNATDLSGYRKPLYDLIVAGSQTVTFTGTQSQGTGLAQPKHEGHSGFTIAQLRRDILTWLTTSPTNVALLLAGVNDLVAHLDPGASAHAAALGALLDDIHEIDLNLQILVAPVPPLVYTQALRAASAQFNAALRREVDARAADGHAVDWVPMQWQGSDVDTDGIHPNDTGYANLAKAWHRVLRSYL